jgi:RNA polymerase sigma-70 factor (ECF subfamily)
MEAYDLYVDHIYRFIYFKVSNKETAEDFSSAVFLKTWNYLQDGNFLECKTLKALLYKIARNLIIDHYRKASSQQNISLEESTGDYGPEIVDDNQDIARQADVSISITRIEKKLAELKDEYREVLVMRYVDELSISEMAKILDKPKGNVRVLIHRATNALKDLVNLDEQ